MVKVKRTKLKKIFTTIFVRIKQDGLGWLLLCVASRIIYRVTKPIYLKWISLFSVVDDHKILFISEPDYADNAKVLYEYLLSIGNETKYIWLFAHGNVLPNNTENTKYVCARTQYHHGFTFNALKEIATSKYLFYTHSSPLLEIKKRDEQIVINLWHGCGYKDIQKQLPNKKYPGPYFDYGFVPGRVFIKTKKIFWKCKSEQIIPIGYPRYDLMSKKNRQDLNFLTSLKSETDKLIIWMPTFRKTNKGIYPEEQIENNQIFPLLYSLDDIKKLNQYCFSNRICLCIKRHMHQIEYAAENESLSNIKFINNSDLLENHVELYSLLQYTDALISDYSSIAIDYLLLDKPIAFCLDDYEDYKNTRGFVFENPLDYMPGHHLYTYDDLISFFEDVVAEIDPYKTERAKLIPQTHNLCENYCARIWEFVKGLDDVSQVEQ